MYFFHCSVPLKRHTAPLLWSSLPSDMLKVRGPLQPIVLPLPGPSHTGPPECCHTGLWSLTSSFSGNPQPLCFPPWFPAEMSAGGGLCDPRQKSPRSRISTITLSPVPGSSDQITRSWEGSDTCYLHCRLPTSPQTYCVIFIQVVPQHGDAVGAQCIWNKQKQNNQVDMIHLTLAFVFMCDLHPPSSGERRKLHDNTLAQRQSGSREGAGHPVPEGHPLLSCRRQPLFPRTGIPLCSHIIHVGEININTEGGNPVRNESCVSI